MTPGSTGIVVDIPPVKSAYTSKMPNWQFRIAFEPEESVLHVRL
jgi:hypothetical protein